MKDNCELCGNDITIKDETNRIVLVDQFENKMLDSLYVCNDCYKKYDFTIGAVEWEEEK